MDAHTCAHCSCVVVEPLSNGSFSDFTNKFSFRARDISAASSAGCALFYECTRAFRGVNVEDQDRQVTLRFGYRNGRVFLKFGNRRASWYDACANEDDPAAAFITRRPSDADVASDNSLKLARSWLSDCLHHARGASHSRCHPPDPHNSMPSRLLAIESGSGQTRLRLWCPGESEIAPYTCLSYCWRADQRTKLRRDCLSRWLVEIPFADLPSCILDAVAVTLRLQFKYIWIDALCIVQDDLEDKAREIGRMPQIYQHATVTICASGIQTCHESFLHPKSPPALHRKTLAIKCRLANSKTGTILLRDCDDDVASREPISKRAWTLQEHLLSPRLLEYGYQRLRWSCNSFPNSQGIGIQEPGGNSPRHLFYSALGEAQGELTGARISLAWWRVVTDFTHRQITFPDDKLPAISAIASELAKNCQGTYLSGLWQEDLPLHLLWRATFPKKPRPRQYRAPSWSWAAVEGPVIHPSLTDGAESWHKKARTTVLKVIESSVQVASELAKYASIRSAHLLVEAPVLEVELVHDGNEFELKGSSFRVKEHAKCFHLDALEHDSLIGSSFSVSVSLLLLIPASVEYRPEGLVIVEQSEGCYRRIGYFKFTVSRIEVYERLSTATDSELESRILADWQLRYLKLV